MQKVKNKKLFLIIIIILTLFFTCVFLYKYLYEKGYLLPHYFEWRNDVIIIDTKAYEKTKQHEFNAPEFNYPITKLDLKNKKFTAYSLDKICFETDDDYKVQDMLYVDVDNDKKNEIVLLLWKRGRYGKFLPFFIDKNDESWDQHIFIFNIKENQIKPKWCSSYVEADVKKLQFDNNRKIFTILDKNGGRTRYKWISWGLENIKPSKFDYDSDSDHIISEVKIAAVGDNLINQSIIRYGEKNNNMDTSNNIVFPNAKTKNQGNYHTGHLDNRLNSGANNNNYDFLYENVKSVFAKNDINIINNETMLVPENVKTSGFPKFATPLNVGVAVKNAGFNVVALANNHTLDMGQVGIETTTNFYKDNMDTSNNIVFAKAKTKNQGNYHTGHLDNRLNRGAHNIDVVGIREKNQDNYIIKDINGIKIGIINFTEFINNLSKNEIVKSNVSNLLDEKNAKRDLDDVVRKSDVTIAVVHWGEEYNEDITAKQKYWSKIFLDKGVDIVIGSHPHILQRNEFFTNEKGNELLVYYSLGNFVSNQENIDTILSAILNIDIVKTKNGIKFKNFDLEPLITHKENDFVTVYLLNEYNSDLAKRHNQKIDIDNIKNKYAKYTSNLVTTYNVLGIINSYNTNDKSKLISDKALNVKNDLHKKIFEATSVKEAMNNGNNDYSIIKLGSYNDKDLYWRLLKINYTTGLAYLECINVIDRKIFDDGIPKSFNESSLHNFLNGEFIKKTFDSAEAEYINTFGVSINCTTRFTDLGFDINDKNFLKCNDGDYWLLNLCNENENTSNIKMGKYVNEAGEIVISSFDKMHGVKPVLKVPIK